MIFKKFLLTISSAIMRIILGFLDLEISENLAENAIKININIHSSTLKAIMAL